MRLANDNRKVGDVVIGREGSLVIKYLITAVSPVYDDAGQAWDALRLAPSGGGHSPSLRSIGETPS